MASAHSLRWGLLAWRVWTSDYHRGSRSLTNNRQPKLRCLVFDRDQFAAAGGPAAAPLRPPSGQRRARQFEHATTQTGRRRWRLRRAGAGRRRRPPHAVDAAHLSVPWHWCQPLRCRPGTAVRLYDKVVQFDKKKIIESTWEDLT